MKLEKTKDGTTYKYRLLNEGKEIAYIKGSLFNEQIILGLHEFYAEDKWQEKVLAQKIGTTFFEDCKKNDSTIIVTVKDSTEKAEWFLKENNFNHTFTHYVFENDLKELKNPSQTFELKLLKEVDLIQYKIMHLVYFENQPIGVLNLRTEHHFKTKILEGSINYIGLLEKFRNQRLGSSLHLLGLHQLKKIGCENYFGGTNSNNQAMLATFKKNNCINTQTQHYYKTGTEK